MIGEWMNIKKGRLPIKILEPAENTKVFFEDLSPLDQEVIIDLFVSIVKNKRKEAGTWI